MQYSGMSLAVFLIFFDFFFQVLFSTLTEFQFGIVLYFLILPTFLTTFIIKNRLLKDISRFMLGLAFTFAIFLVFTSPDWIVKGYLLLNFIPGYYYLQKRRETKNEEICIECQEYEHRPYCSGYQTYQDRESIFLSQASQGGIQDPFALSPDSLDD
ncbi:MAG: hypothetical protein ACW97Z_06740 [Candidatus Hodarchaeales archaeon]|jgi:hypothetical protein